MTQEEIKDNVIESGTNMLDTKRYTCEVLENIQFYLGKTLDSVKDIPISQLDLYAAAANAFVTVSDRLIELLQEDVDTSTRIMHEIGWNIQDTQRKD